MVDENNLAEHRRFWLSLEQILDRSEAFFHVEIITPYLQACDEDKRENVYGNTSSTLKCYAN